jgi:hypothetical protein
MVTYFLSLKIITSAPAYLMPIGFGIVIGIFNFKHYNHKIYFLRVFQVTLISICISFLCFYTAMMLVPIISLTLSYLIELFSSEYSNGLHLRMSVKNHFSYMYAVYSLFVVYPLLVLWSFSYIFKFSKSKFTKVTIITFLILFPIAGFFLESLDTLVSLQLLFWMPFVILPIQIILYQKDIKALF